jgi:hypothetical protein
MTIRHHLLTRALWAGNALAVAVLLAVVLFRFGTLALSGGDMTLPAIGTLQVITLTPPPPPEALGERNPFDPAGMVWREAKGESDVTGTGEFKGVIALPGLRLAVTDRGSVKAGEMLGAGRVVAIEDRAVLVDTGSGRQTLETPGMQRPKLRDFNRASKPALAPVQGNS